MKILIACEESQEVCKAFRERGFEAYSCDIQDCSGGHPEWHIKDDVLKYLDEDWDLIIAHPPCTYLSNAGACRMYRYINGDRWINSDRYDLMLQGRNFFFKMFNAPCKHIAVENPTPMKICQLPKPSQIIQPYDFGHPYSKRTLLWLKGLPRLEPTNIISDHIPYLPSNTSMYAKGKGGGRGVVRGSKNYSKTFPGIAIAMAEQWGDYLLKENGYEIN